MNARKFSEAMGEIDSQYIESAINYRPKKKMHGWFKWDAIAPNFILNGIRYFETPYPIALEKCPGGFEYGGVIENGVVEGNSYYINPQMPEWVYVEQGTKRIGTVDDFYTGYVRYVDERIRGKKFINYDGTIYVSMSSVEVPLDVEDSLYDEIRSTYGLVIEALSVNGFQLVGTTYFEGFDVYVKSNYNYARHENISNN